MTYKIEEVLEACDVLEQHNRTGTPVMKFTVGKWTEQKAIRVVITAMRELIIERTEDKEQLRKLLFAKSRIQDQLDDMESMISAMKRVVE